jgi:hypothetical protein
LSPLIAKVSDHFPPSRSLDISKHQLDGRTWNFPIRQGPKRVRNIRVAQAMIDDSVCLLALALFCFLPSSGALCPLFFLGRHRGSPRVRLIDVHGSVSLCRGIAASKISWVTLVQARGCRRHPFIIPNKYRGE